MSIEEIALAISYAMMVVAFLLALVAIFTLAVMNRRQNKPAPLPIHGLTDTVAHYRPGTHPSTRDELL